MGIAAALINDPDLLILDEPTVGLDPEGRAFTISLISELRQAGKTIILSTHILEEVEAVCTRAIIITEGAVVFDGTPEELKGRSPSGRLDEVFREITTAAAPVLA